MLPGIDGFAVVAELRAGRAIRAGADADGARARPKTCCAASAAGADDYLPKPFELPILLARVRGLLRASGSAGGSADDAGGARHSVAAADRSTSSRWRCASASDAFPLTLMEATLLRYLVQHEERRVRARRSSRRCGDVREDTDTRAIDNFIVRLRRYIEDDPSNPRHLQTVRGVGYRFVAEPGTS